MIVKPPGEAGWAGRQRCSGTNDCNFKYSDDNTPFSAMLSHRALAVGEMLTVGGAKNCLRGVRRWGKPFCAVDRRYTQARRYASIADWV